MSIAERSEKSYPQKLISAKYLEKFSFPVSVAEGGFCNCILRTMSN